MSNPVLVEVTRGNLVESRHRGAVAVADADGAAVLALGDVAAPVFPRSAIKAVQALVLVESGGADRFGFGDEELALACAPPGGAPGHGAAGPARFGFGDEGLALACASQGGEPGHVATVERILAAAGLDASALACGAHWPLHQPSGRALARAGGTASALHNNCSGKHAGFLCAACAMSADARTYAEADHPVQRAVKAALEDLTGAAIPDERRAIDGCAVPTWALPLAGLARAFARFGTGRGLAAGRAAAAERPPPGRARRTLAAGA